MDNCKNFKDLILTDYIDGEMGGDEKKRIDDHVLTCASCRAFLDEVKGNMQFMSSVAQTEPVPENIWLSVKARLQDEEASAVSVQTADEEANAFSLWDNLRDLLLRPWFVPAFAVLALVLLVGSVTTVTYQTQQAKKVEQVEYLASLIHGNADVPPEASEVETLVEEYFL